MAPIDFTPTFEKPQPPTDSCVISYPAPNVLLVRLNRPKDLNCINMDGHVELDAIWQWMDEEPALSVGVITGTGRAFCAGADLKGKMDILLALRASFGGCVLTVDGRVEHFEQLRQETRHAALRLRRHLPTKRP